MSLSEKIKPGIWDDPLKWDSEWATDWVRIELLFSKIEEMEKLLNEIEMPTHYRVSKEQIISNLTRYIFSLGKLIEKKYSR